VYAPIILDCSSRQLNIHQQAVIKEDVETALALRVEDGYKRVERK
jgi:hypothetical protein